MHAIQFVGNHWRSSVLALDHFDIYAALTPIDLTMVALLTRPCFAHVRTKGIE